MPIANVGHVAVDESRSLTYDSLSQLYQDLMLPSVQNAVNSVSPFRTGGRSWCIMTTKRTRQLRLLRPDVSTHFRYPARSMRRDLEMWDDVSSRIRTGRGSISGRMRESCGQLDFWVKFEDDSSERMESWSSRHWFSYYFDTPIWHGFDRAVDY